MNRFTDRVALVTGGDSGIGRATALRLASEGARVVIVARDEEKGNGVVREIADAGGDATFVRTDVGVRDEVRAAVQQTLDRWQRVDVVVSGAGMMTFDPVVDLNEDDWDQVQHVNLRAAFLLAKYAVPHMPRGGAIVLVSSVHAHQTTANVVPYAASKGGLEAFTRGLSIECALKGIRVNCVAPGAIDTPMLWENPNVKSGKEKVDRATVGQPEDVAAVIAFVASDEARFVNGTTIVVDGGRLDAL